MVSPAQRFRFINKYPKTQIDKFRLLKTRTQIENVYDLRLLISVMAVHLFQSVYLRFGFPSDLQKEKMH